MKVLNSGATKIKFISGGRSIELEKGASIEIEEGQSIFNLEDFLLFE